MPSDPPNPAEPNPLQGQDPPCSCKHGDFASQRELLRAVFDCATYGIYYSTAEGAIQLSNDAFLRLLALQRDDITGAPISQFTPRELGEEQDRVIAHVLKSGAPSEYGTELVRRDGFRIPVRISVAAVRDQSGSIIGTVSVVRDVVGELEAARALQESDQRYRAAFCNNPDAIFVIERQGVIVDANPAACELTGVSKERLLNRPIMHLATADPAAAEHLDATKELRENGSTYRAHVSFARADSTSIDAELHGTALGHGLWQLLLHDVTDRVQAEKELIEHKQALEEKVAARTRELEHANAALAHAGRMKDEFLANMSHELRTPLNSVLGLADALLEGVYGDVEEQQKQILGTMRDSGRHLLELINDILDLSKIEAGRLELDYRSISVSEVCQASLRMVRPMAIAKRIGTWMRTDPKLGVVVADERRLKQMLVNLLSNAVKFTPAGGTAGIEAWSQGSEVYFSVTDTGIGIAAPDLRRIFEPFTQIDSSLSRQHEGTGLGLALVRRLAQLHGGRVEVDSEQGRGSRFTIVLPRLACPERDSLPSPEEL